MAHVDRLPRISSFGGGAPRNRRHFLFLRLRGADARMGRVWRQRARLRSRGDEVETETKGQEGRRRMLRISSYDGVEVVTMNDGGGECRRSIFAVLLSCRG